MKVNGPAPRSEQPTRGLGTPSGQLRRGPQDQANSPSTRDQQWPRKPSKPSKVPMLWPSLGSHRCNLLAAAPASRGLLV